MHPEKNPSEIAPKTTESSTVRQTEQYSSVSLQSGSGGCGCGNSGETGKVTSYPFVYALGRVEPRYPSVGVEKEMMQATGRAELASLSDRQALHAVLSDRANHYLARQLCWVLRIEGLETYILRPRVPGDVDLLIDAVRPVPRPNDVDIVIGVKGPLAPPDMCNGLILPVLVFDQMYSFDIENLIRTIPRPPDMSEESFAPAAEELFMRIMQIADNAGENDYHRALNYLVVRYPGVYAVVADAFSRNLSLTGVETIPSRLNSSVRKIVDVVFTFTHRQTGVVEMFFVRVDVTEEFPFLVTKIAPYYSR